MQKTTTSRLFLTAVMALAGTVFGLTACEGAVGEGEGEGEGAFDIPPTNADELADYIAAGHYLEWDCEAEAHAPRAPSPHPINRICSNPLLASSLPGEGLPIGAATIKEIYEGEAIIAWAVGVKVAEGGADDGASVYWFEGDGVAAPAADGTGDSGGLAENQCFACHTDAPAAGGQEQFFTIVRP